MFDDLLEANKRYSSTHQAVAGKPVKQLAVLTCMDTRIDPLAILGLATGDAKIVRNAGARVTDDAVRSLVLAANLLDGKRICVIQHTDCAMAKFTEDEFAEKVSANSGADASGIAFYSMTDQRAALRDDVESLRNNPLIPDETEIAGFIYDVTTGELTPVD